MQSHVPVSCQTPVADLEKFCWGCQIFV